MKTIEEIKAICRETIALSEKATPSITEEEFNSVKFVGGILPTVNRILAEKYQSSRNFSALQAKALLTAIEGLEKERASRAPFSDASNTALETIRRDWSAE